MKRLLVNLGCIAALAAGAVAQDQKPLQELAPMRVSYPNECGFRLREMNEILRKSNSGRPVVIVSHISRNEQTILGVRRLYNARAYLTSKYFEENWHDSFVVTAQGDTVSGLGYLDFFFEGGLVLRILVNKGDDLYWGDCGGGEEACSNAFEEQFFPCRDKLPGRPRSSVKRND